MYELTVETGFSAAHAIVIRGERETVHGHDWHITVSIVGDDLDGDGLLVDFHAVEAALGEIIAPFRNADLNRTPPFDRVNPTAEHVARHIAESLDRRAAAWAATMPGNARPRIASVRVTEAPGCAATFHLRPSRSAHPAPAVAGTPE